MTVAAQNLESGGTGKLKISKIVEGDIMCLRFAGTIDEDFHGKTLSETVKGVLILDLGGVKRISSFGIREWVDFINHSSEKCKAIYFIEVAPKVVDQFNMVANFGGMGKILSFYAPYRCDYCDDDRTRLIQVEEGWENIKNMQLPDYPCDSCGNPEYFDEDPQSYLNHLHAQPEIEPDPMVASFLAVKLNYRMSDAARRLRIDKHIGRATYIKLSGDMDGNFPSAKITEGLEGDVVFDVGALGRIDDGGAALWTQTMEEVAAAADRVFVKRATPGFVEKLTNREALAGKVQLLDIYMPFECKNCGTTAAQLVDVVKHHDVLKFATPPEVNCSDCGEKAGSVASDGYLAHVAELPLPQLEDDLASFIEEAEEVVNRPVAKEAAAKQAELPSVETVGTATASAGLLGLATIIGVTVTLLIVGIAGLIVWKYVMVDKEAEFDEGGRVVGQKSEKVPEWMEKAETAYVWRENGRVFIVGYSHSARENEEAREKAVHAALDILATEIAAGVEEEVWKRSILGQYGARRDEAMEALERAMAARDGDAVRRERSRIWDARERVAKAFLETAYDTPRVGDDFWRKLETRDGTRWNFWVLYTFDEKKLEEYREHYTRTYKVQDVTVANFFPGLAWVYPRVTSGAVVLDVGAESPWRMAGLDGGNMIVECRRRQVSGGKDFVETIEELHALLGKTGGRLECRTLAGSVDRPVGYEIEKPRAPVGTGHRRGKPTAPGYRPPPVNIWDDPTQ